MKLRVLNYGVSATHAALTPLETIWVPTDISDFDAFIYDPNHFITDARTIGHSAGNVSSVDDPQGTIRATLNKHAAEVGDLLEIKGGVVVVLMRPNNFTFRTKYTDQQRGSIAASYSPYSIFDVLQNRPLQVAVNALRAAFGESVILDQTKIQPAYLSGLRGHLKFETGIPTSKLDSSIEVLATDSVGRAVAISQKVGKGTLFLLPVPENVDGNRLGGLLLETVRAKLAVTSIEMPSWANEIVVPGMDKFTNSIAVLELEQKDILRRLHLEQTRAAEILKHRELLFGTGKTILEPAVRRAFRVLGFEVLDDDAYVGEWDLDMTEPAGPRFIGEIEGPEGAVDVQKFRQLLNYWNDEVIEGRDCKGLLIGNAFRNAPPDERVNAFTEHALRGADRHKFALIATTELFKAVCAVLAEPDESFKDSIRASILNAVGVWKFAISTPLAKSDETTELVETSTQII